MWCKAKKYIVAHGIFVSVYTHYDADRGWGTRKHKGLSMTSSKKDTQLCPLLQIPNSLIKRWIHLSNHQSILHYQSKKHKRTWFLIKYCVAIFFPLTEFDLFYQLSWFPLPFLFDFEPKEEEIPRAEPATKDPVFTPFLSSFHIKEDNNVAVNTTKIPNKKSSILQLITYKTE